RLPLFTRLHQQAHHFPGILFVQVSSWLICKHKLWMIGQRERLFIFRHFRSVRATGPRTKIQSVLAAPAKTAASAAAITRATTTPLKRGVTAPMFASRDGISNCLDEKAAANDKPLAIPAVATMIAVPRISTNR